MGPTWGRQDPGGPHVGDMNLAIYIWVSWNCLYLIKMIYKHYVHQYAFFRHLPTCSSDWMGKHGFGLFCNSTPKKNFFLGIGQFLMKFWICGPLLSHSSYILHVLCITGDPLHSRALAHRRPHCSHSRVPGEQWARLCVFTLQGCVQAARLCRGSPVCMQNWLNNTTWHQTNESPIYLFQCNVNTTGYNSFVLKHQRYWSKGTSENMALVVFNRLKIAWKCVI